MKEDFKIGDYVFFIDEGEERFRRISKIAMMEDGLNAIFSPSCACKAIKKPLNEIYHTLEELRKELANNEN